MSNRKEVWNCFYMGIFEENGKLTDMGFSDGVGFCGHEEEETIKDLYQFLHKYYGNKQDYKRLQQEHDELKEKSEAQRKRSLDFSKERLGLWHNYQNLKSWHNDLKKEHIATVNQLRLLEEEYQKVYRKLQKLRRK